MDTKEETKKRLEIAKNISSQLEGIVRGVLLGGSMGFGQNFSVTEKSDIDMVVVCDKQKIRDLEATPYFTGHIPKNILKMFEDKTINLFWVIKKVDSVEVNSYIYETKGYKESCLFKGGLRGYIPTKISEIEKHYGFDGSLISFKRNVTPCGEGYLYKKPVFVNEKFISLPPGNDFTRGFYVLRQENSFFDNLNDKVWDAVVKQLIKEYGPNVDLERASVLKSDWVYRERPEKLPPSSIERIKSETEKRLKKFVPSYIKD